MTGPGKHVWEGGGDKITQVYVLICTHDGDTPNPKIGIDTFLSESRLWGNEKKRQTTNLQYLYPCKCYEASL